MTNVTFLTIKSQYIYNISPKVFGKPLRPSSNNREYHPQDSFWRRFSGYNLSRKPCLRNLQKNNQHHLLKIFPIHIAFIIGHLAPLNPFQLASATRCKSPQGCLLTAHDPLRKSICSRKSYPYLKQVIFLAQRITTR